MKRAAPRWSPLTNGILTNGILTNGMPTNGHQENCFSQSYFQLIKLLDENVTIAVLVRLIYRP
jgi:hypothetical protein